MEITMNRKGDTIIVNIQGRLDVNTVPEAERKLLVPASVPKVELIMDFARLDYLSSYGLRLLLMLAKTVRRDGGSLKLVAVPEMIRHVLETSGLSKFFSIHKTLEEALADKTQPELPEF